MLYEDMYIFRNLEVIRKALNINSQCQGFMGADAIGGVVNKGGQVGMGG